MLKYEYFLHLTPIFLLQATDKLSPQVIFSVTIQLIKLFKTPRCFLSLPSVALTSSGRGCWFLCGQYRDRSQPSPWPYTPGLCSNASDHLSEDKKKAPTAYRLGKHRINTRIHQFIPVESVCIDDTLVFLRMTSSGNTISLRYIYRFCLHIRYHMYSTFQLIRGMRKREIKKEKKKRKEVCRLESENSSNEGDERVGVLEEGKMESRS